MKCGKACSRGGEVAHCSRAWPCCLSIAAIASAVRRRSRCRAEAEGLTGWPVDQLAKVLNVRQAAVSKLEGRDDLLL
jgi:hypothetical protein